MESPPDTNGRRGAFYTLSESSPVRLGLAISFTLGCGALVWQVATVRADVKDEIALTYVSKELFNARMDEMTRGMADIKTEIRTLQEVMRAEK
jgi:hypothetical protein